MAVDFHIFSCIVAQQSSPEGDDTDEVPSRTLGEKTQSVKMLEAVAKQQLPDWGIAEGGEGEVEGELGGDSDAMSDIEEEKDGSNDGHDDHPRDRRTANAGKLETRRVVSFRHQPSQRRRQLQAQRQSSVVMLDVPIKRRSTRAGPKAWGVEEEDESAEAGPDPRSPSWPPKVT